MGTAGALRTVVSYAAEPLYVAEAAVAVVVTEVDSPL